MNYYKTINGDIINIERIDLIIKRNASNQLPYLVQSGEARIQIDTEDFEKLMDLTNLNNRR
jgi:hypothetical protein